MLTRRPCPLTQEVGFGEEVVDGSLVKFWIVQNPVWGERGGEGGFAKVARGSRQMSVETLAVAIDPMV